MNNISMQTEECIKYTGIGSQSKYNKNNWYYLQIKQFMAKYLYSSRAEQLNWFKHIEVIEHKWEQETFQKE